MKNKILAVSLMLVVALSTIASAYSWKQVNGTYYIYNDATGELIKNSLIDVGDNVYYFDSEGKMIVGWWENPNTGKVYFFNNNVKSNYGGMVFGLHMIDGYYRYFTADGSIAAADKEGSYKKVYLEFYADYLGNLYFNNELMRDTSKNKSEYYSDPIYYTDAKFNNEYFAKYGKMNLSGFMTGTTTNKTPGHQSIVSQANFDNSDKASKNDEKQATGGTNYHIDATGRIIDDSAVQETKEFEKYGPMQAGSPSASNN